MTVYIEYVILDNLVIDYLLLKTALLLSGECAKKVRLFFCALLGAVFALLFPLLTVSPIISTIVKLLSGFLITALSASFKTVKSYFITAVMFIALTFVTGGGVIGIFNLLGLNYSAEISIALMIIPAYAIIKTISSVVKFLYRRKQISAFIYACDLILDDVTLRVNGFLDTGNGLYYGDSPVIVCNKKPR